MGMDPCSVCDDTDYRELDAEYFCNTCGTKYDGAKDMEAEVDFHNKSLGFTRIRETRQIHVYGVKKTEGRKLDTHELCQMILLQQIDALIKLGANPKLKELVFTLWMKVLAANGKAFCEEKPLSNKSKRNTKPSKTPTKKPRLTPKGKSKNQLEVADCGGDAYNHEDGSDKDEPEATDELEVDGHAVKASHTKSYSKVLYDITLALCFLGLKYTNPYTMLSDLIRWAKERKVPFLNAEQYFPKDVILLKSQQAFFNKAQVMLDPYILLMKVRYFATLLQLEGFPKISMEQLMKKYIIRLNLPAEMHSLSTRLGECQALISYQTDCTFFEGIAISYIIVLLKILFGIDGHTEREICSCTRQLMELTNHKHQLFLFDDWLRYITERCISSRNAVLQAENVEVENSSNAGINNANNSKVIVPLLTLSKKWKVTEGRVAQQSLKDKEERFRNSSIKYLLNPEDFVRLLDRLNLSNVTIKSVRCTEGTENSINSSCEKSLCEKQTPHNELVNDDLAEIADDSILDMNDSVDLEDLLNTSVSNSIEFGNEKSSTSNNNDNEKSLVGSYKGMNQPVNDDNTEMPSKTEINNLAMGSDISRIEAGAPEPMADSDKSTMDPSLRSSLRTFLSSKMSETLITDRDHFDTVVQTIQDLCDVLHSNYRLCNTKFGPTNHSFDSLLEVCADMLYMPISALHSYVAMAEQFVLGKRSGLYFGIHKLKKN